MDFMQKRTVVLVDSNDHQLGLEDIFDAHRNPGKLHRAVSVILFNSEGDMLLQQRSQKKLLWPEFWSNTVCTHPFEGESYEDCGARRLAEEMGVNLQSGRLRAVYRFEYQADYNHEWSEHELDTVMVGNFDGEVEPNSDEVMAYRWIGMDELNSEIDTSPEIFTPWFKLIIDSREFRKGFDMTK